MSDNERIIILEDCYGDDKPYGYIIADENVTNEQIEESIRRAKKKIDDEYNNGITEDSPYYDYGNWDVESVMEIVEEELNIQWWMGTESVSI